jgi:hypothetical protein
MQNIPTLSPMGLFILFPRKKKAADFRQKKRPSLKDLLNAPEGYYQKSV